MVGVDLAKAPDILYRAYNDAEGVTAKFNLNLLARINRELGANFDLEAFEHHAFYNAERSRIEMHLASTKRQKVRVGDTTIEFRAGETIHTENSYKYSIESFQALAHGSGWSPITAWTDGLFSVHALRMAEPDPERRIRGTAPGNQGRCPTFRRQRRLAADVVRSQAICACRRENPQFIYDFFVAIDASGADLRIEPRPAAKKEPRRT